MKFTRRFALAVLTISTLLPVAFSATGERLVVVKWLSILCVPVILASGLAWMRDSALQNRARNLRHKRIATLVAVSVVALIPCTHWPLHLAFNISRRAIVRVAAKAYRVSLSERARNIRDATHSEGRLEVPCADSLFLIAALPWEPLHENIGTFALRMMIPFGSYPMSLTVRNIDGDRSTLFYWNQRTAPPSSDEVDLGQGWYFTSN